MKQAALLVMLALPAAQVPGQAQVQAQDSTALVGLINAWRAAPGPCAGRQDGATAPLPPLASHPALDKVQVGTGVFLEFALERMGYPVAQAEAIFVTGPRDARAVMDTIASRYCRTVLGIQFSAVGASRSGDSWQIVFARPAPPPLATRLPGAAEAARVMLAAVNTARAAGRSCGARYYPAAPPLAWHGALAEAALAHSTNMAAQRYFSHTGKDGRVVGARAQQAGYRWRLIGENIAAGQESPAEAVAGWLDSPGHCANIMNPGFTEMGAAYGFSDARTLPRVYWTQVFGTPR